MGRTITILALGSRGDVQPFVPLGQALQRAGHHVRVATFAAFAPLIQRAGLTFAALPGDAQALLHSATQGGQLFGHSPVTSIRRFSVYQNCPLPTAEDRLLFILVYLKTYSLQVVHGRLFGMVQGKANQWIHMLLPPLLAALGTLGDAAARSLRELAVRLTMSEAEAAAIVAPAHEQQPTLEQALQDSSPATASPFLPRWHRTTDRPPQRRD